jgi:uncharacterized protein (TIGR00730 family)
LNERTVTVFGSARATPESAEYHLARELGNGLAAAGFAICNGGYGGSMEALARGAKEHPGAHTIGVVSDIFAGRSANQWIDEIVSEPSLIDRMMRLVNLGDAYVVLKGGTGTLLELAAVWEFMNKRLMAVKPIVCLGEFWNPVVHTLGDELAWEGLGQCTQYVRCAPGAADAVRLIKQWFANNGQFSS